ncbi:MAG: hypothetical protein ACT4PL_12340 [Phycisphaerales bacterium]
MKLGDPRVWNGGRRRHGRGLGLRVLGFLSVLSGMLTACAPGPNVTQEQGPVVSDRVPLQTGVFRPGQVGVEVCSLWGIGEIALSGETPKADARALMALRRAGIRVFECGLDEAEKLAQEAEASSGLFGGGSNWIAPGVRYVEVVREPARETARAVGLDGSVLRAPPGALRLLVRAWVEPLATGNTPGGDADVVNALRVHVVPQASETRIASRTEGAAELRSEMDAGLVLARLGLDALLLPGRALVMTFDGPDPEIAGGPPKEGPRSAEPGQVSRVLPEAAPGEGTGTTVGPTAQQTPGAGPIFRTPSLGEVLLTSPAPGSALVERPTVRRRVLIFVPRGGARFELVP